MCSDSYLFSFSCPFALFYPLALLETDNNRLSYILQTRDYQSSCHIYIRKHDGFPCCMILQFLIFPWIKCAQYNQYSLVFSLQHKFLRSKALFTVSAPRLIQSSSWDECLHVCLRVCLIKLKNSNCDNTQHLKLRQKNQILT